MRVTATELCKLILKAVEGSKPTLYQWLDLSNEGTLAWGSTVHTE